MEEKLPFRAGIVCLSAIYCFWARWFWSPAWKDADPVPGDTGHTSVSGTISTPKLHTCGHGVSNALSPQGKEGGGTSEDLRAWSSPSLIPHDASARVRTQVTKHDGGHGVP